ncbi:MAG: hypothetical protein SPJ55_02820, partial [Treponema sp.]|nr:hypothetical protein [Treponema sp.]
MNYLRQKKKEQNLTILDGLDYSILSYEQLLEVNGAIGSFSGGNAGASSSCGGGGYSSFSGSSSGTGSLISSSSSSCSGGGSYYVGGTSSSSSCGGSGYNRDTSTLKYQTPSNVKDYHCDIIAYNLAIDNGVQNPGNWNGNSQTVNQIYSNYYSEQGTINYVPNNTSGYVFYDWDRNGTYDHMEYYS